MADYPLIEKSLRKAGRTYMDLLKAELEFQKHNASGRLRDGFYISVHERGGSLVMSVMNNAKYMWLVNDGNTNGVDADYDDIKEWAISKGFNFDNEKHEKKSVSKIVSELKTKYFTPMGDRVAPRRYFFIDVAFDSAERMGLNEAIKEDIRKQIDAAIGEAGKSKEIKIKLG
jgi:hypothetical protein